jgi:hypothetical protein
MTSIPAVRLDKALGHTVHLLHALDKYKGKPERAAKADEMLRQIKLYRGAWQYATQEQRDEALAACLADVAVRNKARGIAGPGEYTEDAVNSAIATLEA